MPAHPSSPRAGRRHGVRRSATALATVAVVVSAALTACSGSDADDTIELTFTTAASEQQAQDWLWIAEEVERRTDGQVTFRNHYSGTLVEATEILQAVQDGRADVGWVTPTYQPADFPVWYVSQLQYLSDNPEAVARAMQLEYEADSILTDDFEDSGIHSLGFAIYGPNVVGTAEPIDTLADLDGALMRAAGTSNDIMLAAGAEPVEMAVNEVYEGLERGTIDGWIQLPFASAALVGLAEVTPHLTDIGSGPYSAASFAISEQTWNDLPADVQDVFTDVTNEFVTRYFQIQNETDAAACETYEENDTSLSRLPEPEIAELRERSAGDLVEQWKKRATDSGIDRGDVDAFFDSYTARIGEAEEEATTYQNPFEVCSR